MCVCVCVCVRACVRACVLCVCVQFFPCAWNESTPLIRIAATALICGDYIPYSNLVCSYVCPCPKR